MKQLTLDAQGRFALPEPVARQIDSRSLELVSHSSRHLLLAAPAEGEAVVLAGGLGEVAVADLLSFLNMFRKTGVLCFSFPGGDKALYFQSGEIVFAVSTFPEEDLGEILLALGKVDRDTMQKARQSAPSPAAVGKVLVERGTVAPRDLWLATRHQVETIVYHLFTCRQGSFAFVAKALAGEEILRLSMSTQNLIMEGLRRLDEKALFMSRIGSLDTVPVLADPGAAAATAAEQRLFSLVREGRRPVREVLRLSGMGELETLRLLHRMLEKGAVRLEQAPPTVIEGDLAEILAIFNGALTALYRRIVEHNPRFDQQVRLFLRDLPHPFSYVFRDVTLGEDGAVHGGRLLDNLAGLDEEERKRLLVDALNELVYMECMVARQELGPAGSAELIQRVQEIARRVKNLIGRKE